MTARMPLLLAARLRLAPRWLASRARRSPAVIALTVALAVIAVAGVVCDRHLPRRPREWVLAA